MHRSSEQPALYDLIPYGFTCPICKRVRQHETQWCDTVLGPVVCRSCVRANQPLVVSPFASERKKRMPRTLPESDLFKPGALECEAGSCCVCGKNKTRRRCGYCGPCTKKLAYYKHGGGRTWRIDYDGVVFAPTPDMRARYPWGEEALPMRPSAVGSESMFLAQQERMWDSVIEYLHVARKALRPLRLAPDEAERVFYEVGVQAACRSVLRAYVGVPEPNVRQYVYRSVFRDGLKMVFREAKRRRQSVPIEEGMIACDETYAMNDTLRAEVAPEPDPVRQLQELGLTEWERSLLWRRYVDGQSLEEIGESHGVVKSTVGGWIRRIREKIGAT